MGIMRGEGIAMMMMGQGILLKDVWFKYRSSAQRLGNSTNAFVCRVYLVYLSQIDYIVRFGLIVPLILSFLAQGNRTETPHCINWESGTTIAR